MIHPTKTLQPYRYKNMAHDLQAVPTFCQSRQQSTFRTLHNPLLIFHCAMKHQHWSPLTPISHKSTHLLYRSDRQVLWYFASSAIISPGANLARSLVSWSSVAYLRTVWSIPVVVTSCNPAVPASLSQKKQRYTGFQQNKWELVLSGRKQRIISSTNEEESYY